MIQSQLLYLASANKIIEKTPNDKIYVSFWLDTVGDYVHAFLLPVSKYCFYAGGVSYQSVKSVLDYYNYIKRSLNTNGVRWSKPSSDIKNVQFKIRPLPNGFIGPSNCSDLILDSSGDVPLPRMVQSDDEELSAVLSLWIPLRSKELYDPRKLSSLSVLRKYYEIAIRCISKSKRQSFAGRLSEWIDEQLINHLTDEQFYPGFEAILQIRNSLSSEKHVHKKETVDHGLESEKKGFFENFLNSMLTSDVDENYKYDNYADKADGTWMSYIKIVCIVVGCSLIILIGVALIMKTCKNRKTAERKAEIGKYKVSINTKDNQSDEEVILLLRKNDRVVTNGGNGTETRGSSWRYVRNTKPSETSSTSNQFSIFTETEDDGEQNKPEKKKGSAELVPLLPKISTHKMKKKPRNDKSSSCINCFHKPRQLTSGEEALWINSSYQLTDRNAESLTEIVSTEGM